VRASSRIGPTARHAALSTARRLCGAADHGIVALLAQPPVPRRRIRRVSDTADVAPVAACARAVALLVRGRTGGGDLLGVACNATAGRPLVVPVLVRERDGGARYQSKHECEGESACRDLCHARSPWWRNRQPRSA